MRAGLGGPREQDQAGAVGAAAPAVVWTRYDVVPVPKPRMTRADKWHSRPATRRYWWYKAELQRLEIVLPLVAHVVFVLPMPKTWNARRRALYARGGHFVRPDLDNLLKGLWDAVYPDDCYVWDVRATKVWGDAGCIYVRAIEPPELPL